ncbi:MAG TPA: MFS transporter [Candidatus Nanopelagicaceae bacterium]
MRVPITDVRRIQLSTFVSSFDRFAMPPILLSIAHGLHLPLAQVVGSASVYYLVYGLMQPLWGMLSNRIGLATIIKWGTFLGSLATFSAAWTNSLLTLTLVRALAGAFFSATIPAALIYVGSTGNAKRRHRDITDLMSGTALGTALSTLVAGTLSAVWGWRWAFVATALIGIIASTFIYHLAELPKISFRAPFISPLVRVLTNRSLLRLLFLGAIDGAAILGIFTFIPTSLESRGSNTAVAAAVTAIYGFAVLVGSRIVGRYTARITRAQFILIGGVMGAAASFILAYSHHLVSAFLACVLLGFCWASMHTSLQSWSTEVAPNERSIAVSFFAASLFAGSAVASAISGGEAQRHEFNGIFLRGALLLLVVATLGNTMRKRWESENE